MMTFRFAYNSVHDKTFPNEHEAFEYANGFSDDATGPVIYKFEKGCWFSWSSRTENWFYVSDVPSLTNAASIC